MDEGERMKRKLAGWVLLAALAGWSSPAAHAGKFMSQAFNPPVEGAQWGPRYPTQIPNMVGPYGQPVEQRAPALYREPTGADYAHAMLAKQYPTGLLSQVGITPPPPGFVDSAVYHQRPGSGSGIVPTNGANPGQTVMGNPMIAGVPGIIPPGPPGAVAALGATPGGAQAFGMYRTEVRFVGPAGMKISWYAPRNDGKTGFTTQYLEAPARYNFLQSSIYRLKLSDIPNRPGVDLYPTLEVTACNPKTSTFLAHSAVPISFTEEDFEQVAAGNFVVKVIYLPDPQFQDLAVTGPDEVVSSRLEPGVDPILEAKRRGTILAIVRLGNIDLEAPNTPAMDAPDPKVMQAMQAMQQQQMMMMQQQAAMMRAGMVPPNMAGMMGMMPPGMSPPGMPQPGMNGPAAAAPGMAPGLMPPNMNMPGMMPPTVTPPVRGAGASPTAPALITPSSSPVGKATPEMPAPPARQTLANLASRMFSSK